MKLPTEEARNWFYAILWPAGGVASAVILIWMITLIRWDWPAGTEEQRLTILGNIAYGMVGMMALVSLGLTMRNAIKNLKLQAGGMSAGGGARVGSRGRLYRVQGRWVVVLAGNGRACSNHAWIDRLYRPVRKAQFQGWQGWYRDNRYAKG